MRLLLLALLPLVRAAEYPIQLFAYPTNEITSSGRTACPVGTRDQTSQKCAVRAAAIGLNCTSAFMFLAYSQDDLKINRVPGGAFFSATAPVNTVDRNLIAENWAQLFGPSIAHSFDTMPGIPQSGDICTGMDYTGAPGDNCNDWNGFGTLSTGDASKTVREPGWSWLGRHSTLAACSQGGLSICVCTPLPGNYTPSDTRSPTIPEPSNYRYYPSSGGGVAGAGVLVLLALWI